MEATPDESAALAWMDESGGGYKAAAKRHPGVTAARLRQLRARAPTRARPREVPPKPAEPTGKWAPVFSVQVPRPKSDVVLRALHPSAADVMAKLQRGGRVCGITGGQFSLIDLIIAGLDKFGPCDVSLTTWRVGRGDMESLADLLATKSMRSFRLMADRSETSRQMDVCARVRELFGDDAVILGRTHAKIVLMQGDGWSVSVRASMNLNKNRRWEQFDIDDSPQLYAMFDRFFADVAARCPSGYAWDEHAFGEAYRELVALEEASAVDRPTVPAPPLPVAAAQPGSLSGDVPRVEYLASQLAVAQHDMELARSAKAWSALASLHNSIRQTRKALDEELAAIKAEGGDSLSDDELMGVIIENLPLLRQSAPDMFDAVAAEVDRLRTGLHLIVG